MRMSHLAVFLGVFIAIVLVPSVMAASPVVENVTVSENLVDRDNDEVGKSVTLTTDITVQVSDNDNRDDISYVGLWIRDNGDSVVLDNQELTNSTVVDENTENYIYSYNPADDLGNLGTFDLKAQVIDSGDNENTWDWDNHFIVDDILIRMGNYAKNSNLGFAYGFDVGTYIVPKIASQLDQFNVMDSFENDWRGDGSKSTTWYTEGDGSWELTGGNKSATKEIVLTDIDTLEFDIRVDPSDTYSAKGEFIVEGDILYSLQRNAGASTATNENVTVNVSSYSGVSTVKIRYPTDGDSNCHVYFDDLRAKGYASSLDNSWINATDISEISIGVSHPLTHIYEITSQPGEKVNIRVTAFDERASGLDGENTSTFTVNDNRFYRLFIHEETTFDLMSDSHISSENFFARTYTSGGQTHTFTVDEQEENIVPHCTPSEIRLFDNNDNYYRTYRPTDHKENLDMYMVKDSNEGDLYQYNIVLDDPLDLWGPPDGWIELSRYVNDVKGVIIDRHWLAGDEISAWLLYQSRYDAELHHPDSGTYAAGWIDADQDYTKEISVAGEISPENFELTERINDYIRWGTWFEGDNLHIWYEDNSEGTNSTEIYIYYDNSEVFSGARSGNNWEEVYHNAENSGVYWVKLEIDHQQWGFSPWPSSKAVLKSITQLPKIPGGSWFSDMPVPMTNVALFFMFFGLILTFGPSVAGVGIMFTAVVMTFLNIMLSTSISWPVIGLLMFVGFVIQMYIMKR